MTIAQRIKRLRTLLEQAAQHQTRLLPDTDFFSWKSYAETSIIEIFGRDSHQIGEFRKLKFRFTRSFFAVGGASRDHSHEDREATKQVYARDLRTFTGTFQRYLADIQEEHQEGESAAIEVVSRPLDFANLTHLHPAVQQVASSRFASAHYSDAIQKACTALEKAVQVKSGQPATVTGTSLMTTAFSQKNALIQLAADPTEQFGFMNLYQGTVQALRNHFAHNLTELTDSARALEWLGFISALFYKLDEA